MMRRLLLVLTVGLAPGSLRAEDSTRHPQESRPSEDALVFRGGDRILGTWIEGEGESVRFAWRHLPDAEPVRVRLSALSQISPKARPVQAGPGPEDEVNLGPLGHLFGRFDDLDEEYLHLDTWYAGRLAIRREAVRRIVSARVRPEPLLDMADEGAGWEHAASAPVFAVEDGAWVSSGAGGVSRRADLPPYYEMEWELRAETQPVQVQVGLLTAGGAANAEGIWLEIGGNRMRAIQRLPRNQVRAMSWSTQSVLTRAPLAVRIKARVAQPERQVTLFVDGQEVQSQTWPVPVTGWPTGAHVALVAQGHGQYRFHEVEVRRWSGLRPGASVDAVPEHDVLLLADGGTLSGTLTGADADAVRFTAHATDLSIPWTRIAAVTPAGPVPSHRLPRDTRRARIRILGGGQIEAGLLRAEGENLVLSHPALGEFALPLAAVERVDF